MDGVTIKRFKIYQLKPKEDMMSFDIYSEHNASYGADEECDNDEVSPAEAGFMKGYLSA